jgi:dihydropteroate synthase
MSVADGPRGSQVINAEQPDHPLTRLLSLGRPLVMGILNVTPDSFSDGGRFVDAGAAIAHAARMAADGADMLDIGGESTRPYGNAITVSAEEEWDRVGPALHAVVQLGVAVSIDTMKPSIAAKALAVGATTINDVWGLQRSPDMARLVAEHDAGLIIMHNRETVDRNADILADIEAFFTRSLALADRAGIRHDRIVLDPGIGFGKTPEQSIAAIASLDRFKSFGLPLLIGLSRKRFIASLGAAEPHQRIGGSIAGNLYAVRAGAAIVRVHDVAETVQALRIAAALDAARRND